MDTKNLPHSPEKYTPGNNFDMSDAPKFDPDAAAKRILSSTNTMSTARVNSNTAASKTNVDKLQALLDKTGFNEIRRDDQKFKEFFANTSHQDIYRYLGHINQNLREAAPSERGFHDGRMFVGDLISPDRTSQLDILDTEIDAIPRINNPKYRAASAYFTINALHLFPDGNGRTARAVFMLLEDPASNLSEQQGFISHSNNKAQHASGESGYTESDFAENKNLIPAKDFVHFATLGYLKQAITTDDNQNNFLSTLTDKLETELQKIATGNAHKIFAICGGLEYSDPGEVDIRCLKNISGFNELNDQEKYRVNCAFRQKGIVSASALALLKFYQEKGQQEQFIGGIHQKSNPYWPIDHWAIYLDDQDNNGRQECSDWSKADFLHYAELSEEIQKNILKTGIDIFEHPDRYQIAGQNIAEIVTSSPSLIL